MAKYVKDIKGNYQHFVSYIEREVLSKSVSASLEDSHQVVVNDVQVSVLVFERYSYSGGNRVSLSVTIIGFEDNIRVIAIASGGSQATFFKINTWGEENFLDTCIEAVEKYGG